MITVTRTDFSDAPLCAWWESAYNANRLQRDTFFQSLAWNRLWHDHFVRDDDRRELLLLKLEEDGDIVAAAPLFLQHRQAAGVTAWRYAQFLADRLAQYTDLVTTSASTAPLWQAIREYFRAQLTGTWLELHDVLEDSTVRTAGIAPDEREEGETYLRLRLGGLDADGLIAHSVPHMQRELRRSRKRMDGNASLTWEAVTAPDSALVDVLINLNRNRFGSASWFADPAARHFFRDVCDAAGEDAVFSVLRHEGGIIHIMCSWLHGRDMLYVLSGMDEQSKALSPGTTNLDRSICHAIAKQCRSFDFLRGDEPYKREFQPEEKCSEHWVLHAGGSSLRYRLARTARSAASRGAAARSGRGEKR